MHKSEVDEVNIRTAELWLYKADSLAMLNHSVAASSAASLLSALTYNTAYVCGIAAGGNEQSAEDHLARRRDWETTGLPDVHSIKGREPSLLQCDIRVYTERDGPELIYSCWTVHWHLFLRGEWSVSMFIKAAVIYLLWLLSLQICHRPEKNLSSVSLSVIFAFICLSLCEFTWCICVSAGFFQVFFSLPLCRAEVPRDQTGSSSGYVINSFLSRLL